MNKKNSTLFAAIITIVSLIFLSKSSVVFAADSPFQYESTKMGSYISNGIADGDTYNYSYENTASIPVDIEGFINYQNQAYVKKSVKANPQKPGLFDVSLDIKGNQIDHPLDIALVMDYSSSMNGEKLSNALKGLREFGAELGDALTNGNVQIGIVAYNRNVYSTNGFTNDLSELENFLTTTAESHTGTFIQKGLISGQSLLMQQSRPGAQKMLIHIGDGSANRSYFPTDNAIVHTNTGEITDYKGFHTSTYMKEFQTESEKFNTTDNISDPNATIVEKSVVTDATLGTIVAMKESGIQSFSIGTVPTDRGEYIARNIADTETHYHSIDENLVGLGEALKDIANSVDKTISNGTVNDPMGENILLQGTGDFSKEGNYVLQRWKKETDGTWVPSDDSTNQVVVNENNQVITLSNLELGSKDRITLTYHIRLNTEASNFKGETWQLCNARTTLDPTSNGTLLDFPIPSIKAPKVQLSLEKHWKNTTADLIPDKIDYQLSRAPLANSDSWVSSDILSLTKGENFKATISTVPSEMGESDLPLYNNSGDTIIYSLKEINVPKDFDAALSSDGNNFILINTYKGTVSSSTELSSSESIVESSTKDNRIPTASISSTDNHEDMLNINNSSKHYPRTNDTRENNSWLLLGGILLSVSVYFLRKFN